MKRVILLAILLSAIVIAEAQNGNLSLKVGVLNSTTKTQQVDPPYPMNFAGFDPKTGGVLGLRYSYKISKRFGTGIEMQYLLKGHTTNYPSPKDLSYHYLGFSPFIAFHPFAYSKSKYISSISPELGFDYNYSLGTNATWNKASNAKFYKSEFGYSLKLSYQPARIGIQVFHFRPFTPYLKTEWGDPSFDDLKFNFVSGVSILYKFGKGPRL